MANFIGKIQIGAGSPLTLIGSTAYGICNTNADNPNKVLTVPWNGDPNNNSNDGNKYINSEYPDSPIIGSTIHIKFVKGNTVTTNVKLKIRDNENTSAFIIGMPICGENTVLSLTYDEYVLNNDNVHPLHRWIVNDNADTTYAFTGDGNGNPITQQPSSGAYFTVTPSSSSTTQYVPITGLRDGAYQSVTGEISTNTEGALLPNVTAIKSYVAGLGLTGAMHFRGTATINIANNPRTHYPHINGYDLENNTERQNFSPEDGDVILYEQKEFVWASGKWNELGDEGSYVLNSAITTQTISVPSYATVSMDVPSIQDITFSLTDSDLPGVLKITRTAPTTTIPVSATLTPDATTTYTVVKLVDSNNTPADSNNTPASP